MATAEANDVETTASNTKIEKIRKTSKRYARRLEASFVYKPPYCMGTMLLPKSDFKIFYSRNGSDDAR